MRRGKVLVVGLDGLRWDRVRHANAPHLIAMAQDGLYAPSQLDVSSGAQTMSAPGWSTVATGVWADRHGVRENSFAGAGYDRYPDFLTRAKQADPNLSTFVAVDWLPLVEQGTFSAAIDRVVTADGEANSYLVEDRRIVAQAVDILTESGPDASFVYIGGVDRAGHTSGAISADYTLAIDEADRLLGDLLGAVRSRTGENWLVLVTTDHGHTDAGGHGEYSDAELGTFILGTGAGLSTGHRTDTLLVDLAATALDQLGIPLPPDLPGQSLLAPR